MKSINFFLCASLLSASLYYPGAICADDTDEETTQESVAVTQDTVKNGSGVLKNTCNSVMLTTVFAAYGIGFLYFGGPFITDDSAKWHSLMSWICPRDGSPLSSCDYGFNAMHKMGFGCLGFAMSYGVVRPLCKLFCCK